MSDRISSIIKEFRKKRIEGICIDLVPFSETEIENVVEIRNKEKNRYFLNQTYKLNVEGQLNWYQSYLERDNDIYWCIYNKKNQFIGTVRIYDIDEENNICDQGSFMIDEEFSEGAPYTIEAEILSLDFLFKTLKIGRVINENRGDNKVMNNLSKKIGFEFIKNTIINDVNYNYYLLSSENYDKKRQKFVEIIDYWGQR